MTAALNLLVLLAIFIHPALNKRKELLVMASLAFVDVLNATGNLLYGCYQWYIITRAVS